MKKILCVFLAIVMAFSMATVAFAAGEGEDKSLPEILAEKLVDTEFINSFNGKTLDFPDTLKVSPYYNSNGYDVNKIIEDNKLSGVEFLGLDLGYMYGTSPYGLDWGKLSVSRTNMSSFWGGLNTYLVSFLKENYTNVDRMCTGKHATAIANLIGRLLKPSFTNVSIDFSQSNYSGGSRNYTMKKDFYQRISDDSGLTGLIANYWLRQVTVNGATSYEPKVNYKPLLIGVLNIPLYNDDGSSTSWGDMEYFFTVPSKEYKVPSELGGFIIKSVIENAINEGPIQYLLNVLQAFIKNYIVADDTSLKSVYLSVSALLTEKINAGYVTAEGLKSFSTLFNTLSNNNSASNTGHLQFVTFPTYRFKASQDNTEAFLYLMAYLNLVGKHQKNSTVVTGYKNAVNRSSELNGTQKTYVNYIIDAMFNGNLTDLAKAMPQIEESNLHNVGKVWLWNFGDFYARMISAITSFFDGIFRTIKNGINLDLF